MLTSAGIAARPFQVCVAPRVCSCDVVVKELSRHKRADKAVATIAGYWNVYVGFFGEQTYWLEFSVIDLRDGTVVWRNGRRFKEEENAGNTDTQETGRGEGKQSRVGVWLAGNGRADGW